MATYTYQIVPFEPVQKKGESPAKAAASSLDKLIEKAGEHGFEYYRMDHYSTYEPAGCLAAFLGNPGTYHSHDVIIFRRPK